MTERKDIDRLFQEKLKDFEVYPSSKMWTAIETKMQANPKRRKFNIWSKSVKIAAVFTIFATVAAIYLMPKTTYFSFLGSKNTLVKKDSSIEKSVITDALIKKDVKEKDLKDDNEIVVNENLLNSNNESEKTTIVEEKEIPVEKEIYPMGKTSLVANEKEKVNKENNFTIATVFAPIYLNSLTSNGMLLNEYSVVPELSYAYGVKFSYKLSNRISLQSGVNIMNIGYTAKNIYVPSGVAEVKFSNLSNSPVNTRSLVASSEHMIVTEPNEKGVLNHVFGYVEIPLEVKYRLIDGKIGMNLIGGFSTLLLNKNESFIKTNTLNQSLGEMENIRSVNFSGNIGVDIDYLINDNLYINLAPTLKIQTGSFVRNSQGFYPYYLGIYTGINYKF